MSDRLTTYTHDGLEFDVRDEGPVDGPVAVLLHGFPQRAESWTPVAQRLHAAGMRTIAPDQRGYSPGARPRRRRDYTLTRLAADVVALVGTLDSGPVHLVGHDWGAAVAWTVAADRPDLVQTLTTVSVPHPRAMLESLRGLDQLRRSWYMAFFQLPFLPERLLRSPRIADRALAQMAMPASAAATFRRGIIADDALSGGLGWYRAMPFLSPGSAPGVVRVPTTHVWSDRDPALGRRGAELSEQYVDADYRLEVLAGVGHWIPEEQPDRLADLILARAGRGQ